MMFAFPVTIPANTPAASPVIVPLVLTAGQINRVIIWFPSGHLGLTHLTLSEGLHQVFPSNPGNDFAGSNGQIDWNDEYELTNPPYTLTAQAWNLDTVLPHTIYLHIAMTPTVQQASLLDQVKSLLGVGGA